MDWQRIYFKKWGKEDGILIGKMTSWYTVFNSMTLLKLEKTHKLRLLCGINDCYSYFPGFAKADIC